jgi:hypothetical protein
VIDRVGPTLRPEGPPQGYHQWRQLSFLHWEVPVAEVQATLPPGLHVDTFEGRAFVGLVPFTMQGIRPTRLLPPVPGLSAFHETNVRTYVLHEGGAPGVWFYSLDAASSVAAARALLHRRAFIDCRTESGATPLMKAASTGSLPVAQLLLEARAAINLANGRGQTALDMAKVVAVAWHHQPRRPRPGPLSEPNVIVGCMNL